MVSAERQIYNKEPCKTESTVVGRRIVQYELDFDIEKYSALANLRGVKSVYEREKEKLDLYTKFNIETALGERYNCILSKRRDEIINGKIYGQNTNESLLSMFERGREYRKKHGSSEEDQKREQAEVAGFKKIQKVLCNPETEVGTMMISISPPGESNSIYKHNFYDIFALREDELGKRYVEYRRYSSALMNEEYIKKLRVLSSSHPLPIKAGDKYFLSNPVKMDPNPYLSTANAIHEKFHRKHSCMKEEDYKKLIEFCQPAIKAYLRHLEEDPFDMDSHEINFQAILKIAELKVDEWAGKPKNIQLAKYEQKYVEGKMNSDEYIPLREEIRYFGMQEVRAVHTSCGFSGGARSAQSSKTSSSISELSGRKVNTPFSVLDFAGNDVDNVFEGKTLDCKCPVCGRQVEAKISHGKITCPECNASAGYEC